ncbi:uncharacterized protein LOC100252517 [Vitis vinifera]|uniref:uncharacterized protein LOC100252517 n=1 Tax=Vitis vinifera TaxID=29760 RepID=UPI0008FEB835|nr:uncharacterized protein LOC100252517 [Vitis vinifera]|eukprot:XP_019080330.1 PREDICTED: uncharacterized protein LOC100252517 isoform X1 [Vitis vinifera]
MDAIEERVAEKESGGCIDLCLGEAVVDLTGHIHQLPCCIKYNGPCSVSHYFKPKHTGIEVEGLKVEEAFFRGRKLQGTTIHLPEGYSDKSVEETNLRTEALLIVPGILSFVLGKKSSNTTKSTGTSEGNMNRWETNAKFQAITFWNHDNLPSQDDSYVRSFHWLAVSKALHKPAMAEDLRVASLALEQELCTSEK